MKIGILGSGRMGATIGRQWASCGHEVTFAYSRSPDKLARLAHESGAGHASVADAVNGAEVLLLAVHWSRVPDVLEQAGDMAGRIVLSCCVPLDLGDANLVVGMTTSGAEELAALRPKARWVSCLNTVPSEAFAPVFRRKDEGDGERGRPQVLACSDDAGAKDVAGALIRDLGFEPRDAGRLRTARFIEPFAMVTAELAYGQPGGPALVYRFDKLN